MNDKEKEELEKYFNERRKQDARISKLANDYLDILENGIWIYSDDEFNERIKIVHDCMEEYRQAGKRGKRVNEI